MSMTVSGMYVKSEPVGDEPVIIGEERMTMEDFCTIAYYVMTNTDLMQDDPRMDLFRKIKRLHCIEGYNRGGTRLG